MLLEHKIKIYDALQNLPTVDENKHYGTYFLHMKSMQRMFQIHQKKTRVSILGVVKQVNYLREKYY